VKEEKVSRIEVVRGKIDEKREERKG